MGVRHLDDGSIEIIPPSFLWWSAKHVILSILLADFLVTVFFLLKSSNLLASIFLGLLVLSVLFTVGYLQESFTVIYIHFVFCLLYILACSIAIPTVYFNQKICNSAVECKTVYEWMEYVGLPVVAYWVYCFTGAKIVSHVMMTPVSLRMMKYTASCEALERVMTEKEIFRKQKTVPTVRPRTANPILV